VSPAAPIEAPTMLPLPAGETGGSVSRRADPWLIGATVALLTVGLVVVYSASAVRSYQSTGASTGYLFKHLSSVAIGLVAMSVTLRVPVERWSRLAYPLLGLSLVLLIAVFVPGLGRRVNGALRWLSIGPLNFQPAELAKLAVVVFLAHSLAKKRTLVRSFSVGILPHMLVVGLIALLVILQPDFGTCVIIVGTLGLVLFAAGARVAYLILGALLAVPPALFYISTKPHAWKRILAFVNPEAHKRDIGYQIWESLVSFGSGGAFGAGLGRGQQKLYFLPEAHTDFVFAVVGEELGFVGVVLVVALFGILIARGLRIARHAETRLATFLAFGVVGWLGLQTLTNMLVVVSLLPTKGLTLPLVSFGRSSMIVTLAAIGIVLRVGAEAAARAAETGKGR
jgi:cell division protein FtsW